MKYTEWTRRLLVLALCAALLPVSASAAGEVRVTLPGFPVTLGGQTVDPEGEEYPFLVYRDITYLPLTYFGCRLLGLYEKWTPEGGLVISDAGAKGEYVSTPRMSRNSGALYARRASGRITLCGESIDNSREAYPFLLFRDVTYLPMTWDNMYERLGCSYRFDGAGGLAVDREQSTNGRALYLPLLRRGSLTGAVAAWEGWFWFQDDEGWLSRVPMEGGAQQKLFQPPRNERYGDGTPLLSLTARDSGLYLTYHLGGATMGHDEQLRFRADGSSVLLSRSNGPIGDYDDLWIQADTSLMPHPGNLRLSRDRGATWEEFGAAGWVYGWSYRANESGGFSAGNRTGDRIGRVGDSVYLLATDASGWGADDVPDSGRFSRVCRVELSTGRTEAVSGPAESFELSGGAIWYVSFDGKLHRCALDGSADRAFAIPAVREFRVDGGTVYALSAPQGEEPCLCTAAADGSGQPVTALRGVRSLQLDGGYLTALLETAEGDGAGLAVFRDGKKLYALEGPDILAAGVSGGKLYYVLD